MTKPLTKGRTRQPQEGLRFCSEAFRPGRALSLSSLTGTSGRSALG